MREYLRLENPVFPIFLESYIPLIDSFVKKMYMNASPQRQHGKTQSYQPALAFARHLIIEFYMKSGSLEQLERDILLLQ